MAYRILVLAMLITLHSSGLLFASYFTYQWLVENQLHTGVFGMCEYFNKSTIDRLFMVEKSNQEEADLMQIFNSKYKNETNKQKSDKDEKSSFDTLQIIRSNLIPTSSLPSIVKDKKLDLTIMNNSMRSLNSLTEDNDNRVYYERCFQFLWPYRNEAFRYLSSNSNIN